MNYIYINKNTPKIFMRVVEELPEEYYALGNTWQDYLDGKCVLLSSEQVAFYEEYPTASVYEVWNMQLTPSHVRTLDEAKNEKIYEIEMYDNSDEVNSFNVIVNGEDGGEPIRFEGWFTPAERSNYRSSIDAAKLLGIDTLSFYVGSTELTVTTAMAEQMLAMIQIYADNCYMVTKRHEAAVNELETIEEVDAYVVSTGYPEKLTFNF